VSARRGSECLGSQREAPPLYGCRYRVCAVATGWANGFAFGTGSSPPLSVKASMSRAPFAAMFMA